MTVSVDLEDLPEDVRKSVANVAAGYGADLQPTTGPGVGQDPRVPDLADDLEGVIKEVNRVFAGDISEIAGKTDPEELRDDSKPKLISDSGQFPGVHLPEGQLPGFHRKGDTCGDDVPLVCDHCGKPVLVGKTCSSYGCKRCAPANIRDAAEGEKSGSGHVPRLKAAAKYGQSRTPPGTDVYYHHVSISFAKIGWRVKRELADDSMDALQATKEVVKEITRAIGLRGGYMYYHSYRSRRDHEPGDDGALDDRGFWKNVLFQQRDWDGDVRGELSFQPHFHLIGVSEFVKGGALTEAIEQETGIVSHRITQGEDSSVSIYDDYDLARAVTYAASHSMIYESGRGIELAAFPFSTDFWGDRTFYGGSNPIEVSDELQEEMRKVVREVVPDTLGLPYESMICQEELEDSTDLDDLPSPELVAEVHDHSRGATAGGSPGGTGGDTRLSTPGAGELPRRRDDRLPSRGAGELPIKSPRDRGDLRHAGDTWDTPGPPPIPDVPDVTEGRLEALRRAEPFELIAEFDGVTEGNVWTFKNAIQEASSGAEICGGALRNPHRIKDRINSEDWRRNADHAEEALETLSEFDEFGWIEWEGSGAG